MNKSEIEKEAYKIYTEKGQSAVFDFANEHNVPYAYCSPCETSSPSLDGDCLVCASPTIPECPVCNRTNISPDTEPDTNILSCDDCGSEHIDYNGEITLDARIDLTSEEIKERGWNQIVTS